MRAPEHRRRRIIIAGNYRQATEYCHHEQIPSRDAIVVTNGRDARRLRGLTIHEGDVAWVGTWWDLPADDLDAIESVLTACAAGATIREPFHVERRELVDGTGIRRGVRVRVITTASSAPAFAYVGVVTDWRVTGDGIPITVTLDVGVRELVFPWTSIVNLERDDA